jgi:hypothetical protein
MISILFRKWQAVGRLPWAISLFNAEGGIIDSKNQHARGMIGEIR